MKLKNWYDRRGPKFIMQRGTSLLQRYALRPEKAMNRINSCVSEMAALDCSPTFPTTGSIAQRYPKFVRSLQDAGAEIAVHGYDHINLRDLPVSVAVQQLVKAEQTFKRVGIEVHGFRCPYLGFSDEMQAGLPPGIFEYSSNHAIYWGWEVGGDRRNHNLFFDTLSRFYNAQDSSQVVSLPRMRSNMVEIPVCVPDDLQFYDGLKFDGPEIAQTWDRILHQIHQRGELFTLLFHTELASIPASPFTTFIQLAQHYQPRVWIARLQDISSWWKEKSNFKTEITPITTGLRINFSCTSRATVLVRGLNSIGSASTWDGDYRRLQSSTLDVPATPRPFVGLGANVPEATFAFLRDQGYILDASETASSCGIYLDRDALCKLTNEVELVDYIEKSAAPLVRFWRWPDGMKGALCITGDLDALTLVDYISRLILD